MVWLAFGGFYLLLVTFFLGAFALSRRADDEARHVEQQLLGAERSQSTQGVNKIHQLVETDQNTADATTAPLVSDSHSDRRLAG